MNDYEYIVVEAMERFGGSFVQSLAAAFHQADPNNFRKLKNAFPEYWAEYEKMAAKMSGDAQP